MQNDKKMRIATRLSQKFTRNLHTSQLSTLYIYTVGCINKSTRCVHVHKDICGISIFFAFCKYKTIELLESFIEKTLVKYLREM